MNRHPSLGKIAQKMCMGTVDHSLKLWDRIAAAITTEHERRKWRPMSTCPEAGDIIAGYWDGYDWIQTMGEASTLRTFNEYTHWQHAPEAAKP